jgi:hypothetical protein
MEVRNAFFLLSAPPAGAITAILRWRLYGDHQLVPLCRSGTGAITPIIKWRLYADHGLAPLRRSVTPDAAKRLKALKIKPPKPILSLD